MRGLQFMLLLLALPVALCAQDKEPKLASGSEYLVRPNELGFNMAPIGVFLLRGESNHPRFAWQKWHAAPWTTSGGGPR